MAKVHHLHILQRAARECCPADQFLHALHPEFGADSVGLALWRWMCKFQTEA